MHFKISCRLKRWGGVFEKKYFDSQLQLFLICKQYYIKKQYLVKFSTMIFYLCKMVNSNFCIPYYYYYNYISWILCRKRLSLIFPLIDMISCFCTNESFSFSECQEMALSKPEHPKTIRNIHMFDNIWTEEKFPFRDSLRYVYDDILTNKKPNHNF